jgi:hypothetical protein
MYIHGWSLVVPFMIFTSKRNKVVIVGHYIASPFGKLFSYFNTVMPLRDKICQSLAAGQWFSPSTLVSYTNKTDRHDITEKLLKVALNTIKPTNQSNDWKAK